MILSSTLKFVVLIVVVVPCTIKLPDNVKSANVGELEVSNPNCPLASDCEPETTPVGKFAIVCEEPLTIPLGISVKLS